MKSFSINTIGCKVNQYESQQIRTMLEQFGLKQVMPTEKPQLVIINTCCVTHRASAKSRQCIRKAQRLYPESTVIVCGCLTRGRTGELDGISKEARIVKEQCELAATLLQTAGQKAGGRAAGDFITASVNSACGDSNYLPALKSFSGHTRAFLKVQDGCDGRCSYCIIPRTRPVVKSRAMQDVLGEARALVDSGHKEIVVTGVFLGSYGQTTVRRAKWDGRVNPKFAELLGKMARIEGLERIRLSSLEPGDVGEELLEVMADNRNILPHLHLSLQSGSDEVLKKMGRQYGAAEFFRKVERLKDYLDRPAITTDIIVGFPGESEDDFARTVELAEEAGFAKVHVFSFSARRGTAAARMQGVVDKKVIKERARVMNEVGERVGAAFREQFVGDEALVLVEDDGGKARGRTERYFMAEIRNGLGREIKKGDLVNVRLKENCRDGMVGELI